MNTGIELKPVLVLSNKNDLEFDAENSSSGFEFLYFNTADKLVEYIHEDFDGLVLCCVGTIDETSASCYLLRQKTAKQMFPLLAIVDDAAIDFVALLKSGCTDIVKRPISNELLFFKIAALIAAHNADEYPEKYSVLSLNKSENLIEIRNIELNIRFLIDSNECETVLQLGECLLLAIACYSKSSSMQMRSLFEEKTFYLNGAENELDALLLNDLAEKGRCIEFDRYCVINYGPLSLLLKDMPSPSDSRYVMIQESALSLLQSAASRLKFLDARETMKSEHRLSSELIKKMKLLKEMLEVSR